MAQHRSTLGLSLFFTLFHDSHARHTDGLKHMGSSTYASEIARCGCVRGFEPLSGRKGIDGLDLINRFEINDVLRVNPPHSVVEHRRNKENIEYLAASYRF